MNESVKILIAEDDTNLGYILSEYLKMHHYKIRLCVNGIEALKVLDKEAFDLCILDVMMPEMDGFTLARRLREKDKKTPIIFLTARSLKIDKLKGFNVGADDYLVKPVDEEELIARIKAILKRTGTIKSGSMPSVYPIGTYFFDYENQTLTSENYKKVLTIKEAQILKALCERKGKVLDRSDILKQLWGENNFFSRKSMDVFIYKLRKYLASDPNIKIKNIYGKGFVLQIHT